MEQRPLPPSGRPPPPPGGVHARGMSPRNSSAMMAASMAMGGTPRGRGGAGIGVFAQGSTDSLLDPAAEDEAERLRKKRQAIFRSKYEVDEKIVSRNKALVNLVKSLGRTNLRQAEEIAGLKDKVAALEDQLSRLQPLEALLAYMQQSSDDTVLALLAADDGPSPPTAGAPAQPPSEVMERLVTLLQTCGEGVDDLGPDILQSEAQACDMAAAGNEGWVDAIAAAERQRKGEHEHEHEQTDERLHGGRRARRAEEGDDGDGQQADEWMGFGDDEDAFAAEIAAVGTHLQQVCENCGETYIEANNSDLACRFHPGTKKVDAAWNSVWTCCGLKHAMRGCTVCRHVPSLADDAEPDDASERS